MISRHWKGIAKRDEADRYVAHLKRETFPNLAALPGFVHANILRREVVNGIEFQVVAVWDSLRAIKRLPASMLKQRSFRRWHRR